MAPTKATTHSLLAQRRKTTQHNVDSLFSLMSVSILLLAFLVALNAGRIHKVSENSKSSDTQTQEITAKDQIDKNLSPALLRSIIPLEKIFQKDTTSLTETGYLLASSIASLLSSRPAELLLVVSPKLDQKETEIELNLERAAILQRMLIDSHIPRELFRVIIQASSASGKEDSLHIVFNEDGFHE